MIAIRVFTLCLSIALPVVCFGQVQAPVINSQIRHTHGQTVVPVYEGWYRDSENRQYVSYGYVNLNLLETVDIPLGPANVISPGNFDQGQPTHFLPGHQKGVFVIEITAELVSTEITWTLGIPDQVMTIPSNLESLYQIEGLVKNGGPFPGNTPPEIKFDWDSQFVQGPRGTMMDTITTRVNQTVDLNVWITDDGLPGYFDSLIIRSLQGSQRRRQGRQLNLTWSKYRGTGKVHFDALSPEIKSEKAKTVVRFEETGQYMLRVLASDGSGFNGCCWTNGYVKVVVE